MVARHAGVKMLIGGVLSAWLLVGYAVLAHERGDDSHARHGATAAQPQQRQGQSAEIKLVDRELVTHDGQSVKFPSEVIADQIVVMDFIYTTCTTVCPVLSAIMVQVQHRLGDRVDAGVRLVSISVDPTTDTPARLTAYARQVGAKAGWTWLTGQKSTVDQVLKGLGVYTPNSIDHPAVVLVGDGRRGVWTPFFGFPAPDQILAKVDELLVARQNALAADSR